ncbi:MAG: hypothetical protein Q4F66_04470 [Clostridium sp.]|nr:hypothetical protein [Clostridium sp.]
MEYVNAQKIAEENGLILKIATSVRNFDSYNSFYNIYGESEEPCRRIAIITRNEMLEEVYEDSEKEEPVTEGRIVDDSIWLKDYTLLDNPDKIDLSELMVSRELVQKLIEYK